MPPALAIVLAVLSPLITIISLIVGIAVLWGKFSTMMHVLGVEVDRLRETVDEQQKVHASFREDVLVRFAQNEPQSRVLVKARRKR